MMDRNYGENEKGREICPTSDYIDFYICKYVYRQTEIDR